jgi:hypothetical protein
MDILRNGDFPSRAALSFGMVDVRRVGIITKADFEMFMHDFLLAWSTLTNFIMSTYIYYDSTGNEYENSRG